MKNIVDYIFESKFTGFVLLSGSGLENEGNYSKDDLSSAINDARKMSDKYHTSSFYVVKTINNEYADIEDKNWYDYCVFETDAEDNDKLNKVIDNLGNTICYGNKNACHEYLDGLTDGVVNSKYYVLPITTYEVDYLKEHKFRKLS